MREPDYVIIGAGSAGCVLANRLSADPSIDVLLLEAGPGDWHPFIAVPFAARLMTRLGMYDWGDWSEPEPALHGRRMQIIHGKVVGGSSSLNYMAHTRGHPADYDRWAQAGAGGWSYRDLLPFFQAGEAWEGPPDPLRGTGGEIGSRPANLADPVCEAWLEALKECQLPRSDDFNGSSPEGFSPGQYSIKNGRRSSAGREFLGGGVRRRRNLRIVTRAFVTKIGFDRQRAVSVEYVRNGVTHSVAPRCEIVASLGAINTPHLLMLSGLGPADHLRSHGIPVIADLPVGRRLKDHIGFSMEWRRRQPGELHRQLRLDRIAVSMLRAYLFGTGPAAGVPGTIYGFIKSQAALAAPDLQFLLQVPPAEANAWCPGLLPPYQDTVGLRVQLNNQQSAGSVSLNSADPKQRPRIVYDALSHPDDLAALRRGFRIGSALGGAQALSAFRGDRLQPSRDLTSDQEIDAYIRAHATQLYHPGCTCRMGRGPDTVVGPDLKVHGIDGLRIADASIMPELVTANTNIPTQMIGAKAAALILRGDT